MHSLTGDSGSSEQRLFGEPPRMDVLGSYSLLSGGGDYFDTRNFLSSSRSSTSIGLTTPSPSSSTTSLLNPTVLPSPNAIPVDPFSTLSFNPPSSLQTPTPTLRKSESQSSLSYADFTDTLYSKSSTSLTNLTNSPTPSSHMLYQLNGAAFDYSKQQQQQRNYPVEPPPLQLNALSGIQESKSGSLSFTSLLNSGGNNGGTISPPSLSMSTSYFDVGATPSASTAFSPTSTDSPNSPDDESPPSKLPKRERGSFSEDKSELRRRRTEIEHKSRMLQRQNLAFLTDHIINKRLLEEIVRHNLDTAEMSSYLRGCVRLVKNFQRTHGNMTLSANNLALLQFELDQHIKSALALHQCGSECPSSFEDLKSSGKKQLSSRQMQARMYTFLRRAFDETSNDVRKKFRWDAAVEMRDQHLPLIKICVERSCYLYMQAHMLPSPKSTDSLRISNVIN